MKLYLRTPVLILLAIAAFIQSSPKTCTAEDRKQLSGYETYNSQFIPETLKSRFSGKSDENDIRGEENVIYNNIGIIDATSAEDALTKFLQRFGKSQKFPETLNNFRLVRKQTKDNETHFDYQQTFKDLPIFDSYLKARIRHDDKYSVTAALVRQFSIPDSLEIPQNPNPEAAIKAAAEAIRRSYKNPPDKVIFGEGEGSEPRPELGIIEYKGPARVAWYMMVYSKNPPGAQWKIFVDAITNEVISIHNITVVD